MRLEELIGQFVTRVNYPANPVIDGGGGYAFSFDGLRVLCREEAPLCSLTGVIGAYAKDHPRREDLIRRLLQISLVRAAKTCDSLTLDKARGEWVLYRRFDYQPMGPAAFEEEMDGFLNEMEFWVEQLARETDVSTGIGSPGLRP